MIGKFLDQLKEKVEPLKKKLPLGNKDDEYEEYEDDEDEDDEDFDAEDNTAQVELPDLDNSDADDDDEEDDEDEEDEEDEEDSDDDDDDEDDEDDDDDAAKAKKKKLIQLVLILAIGYLAVDTFLLSSEDNNAVPEVPQVKRKRPKRQKKRRPKRQKVAEKPKEEKAAQVEKKEVVQEKKSEEVKPKEIKPAVVEEKKEVVVEKKEEPVVLDLKGSQEKDIKMPNMGAAVDDSALTNMDLDTDVKAQDKLSDQLTQIMKKVESEKEVIKYEYTAPPNYEDFGKSLVYNCKGRHWACVDRQAHFKCYQNQQWSKQEGKKPECVLSKIMATPADCRTMQLYNINMVVEVPDCN